MKKIKIEVCAASVQSALNAQQGGAHRVELCTALELGGLTPSPTTIQMTRSLLDIEVFVLIRPRAGDFYYSDLEFEIIKQDILFCKNLRANEKGKKIDGVVVGLLKKDGEVDVLRTKELVQLAAPMQVTFHRAFDRAKDPFASLEKIISTGAHRILTSGQHPNAIEGKELLQRLVKKSNNRITIMPGAGINAGNILEIIQSTQANEFHLSGKALVKSQMTFENSKVQFSQNGISENDYFETEIEKIRRVMVNA